MGQCDDARYALLVHIDDDASDLSASKHERHPQPDMTAPTKVLRCCKLTRLNVAVGTVVLIIVLLVYTNCFSLWGGVVRSQGSAEGAAAGGVVSPDGLHTPPRDFTYLHLRNSSNSSRGPGGEDFLFDDGRVSDNGKIRYKHTKRRLPHAIIIGARKAGTRALLTFMNMHPQVQVAKNEVHFFDSDENYGYGLEWYRKKMPYSFPDQITVEKSPAYFVSDTAPARAYAMNNSVKLLLILRDPVERAVSDYLQIRENKINRGKAPMPAFEELALNRDTGAVDETYNPIKRSVYWRYLQRWLNVFPRRQVLVLSGEQLVREPFAVLEQVETFLGIEHRISKDNFYFNESRGFYCFKSDVEERCLVESKGRPHPAINPIVLQKLRSFFRQHNHRLYRLVDRDFGWP